ncbi:MAG: helix-turn-helix domain-containing protein [Candidatus Aminicenantes bacterium]|nr:helix-turn-helix domain-containing protein [Candidatus Aminicenantes bacterium]
MGPRRELPMKEKEFITIPQLARLLGISRIAVYRKVKKGEIGATRIGRNYAIPKERLEDILGKTLKETAKKEIDKAVKKTVLEYGEALRRLADE